MLRAGAPVGLCRARPAARELPAARVALRSHLEQTWSGSSRPAHSGKCFCELGTGQRAVPGWAGTQMISYFARLPQGVCKVWFLFYPTFELKKQTVKEQIKLRSTIL